MFERYYGRGQGRGLSEQQKALLEETLPAFPWDSPARKHLEIGFGMGHFLRAQSQAYPEDLFIGLDPFANGLITILADRPPNVYVYREIAETFLPKVPDQALDVVYILHPDPWPKKRHHKRRLIQPDFLTLLAQKLKPEGRVFLATDHEEYYSWMERIFEAHPDFVRSDETLQIETKYSQRGVSRGLCYIHR